MMEAFGKSLLQLEDERQHERDDLLHKLVELDQIPLMRFIKTSYGTWRKKKTCEECFSYSSEGA